MVRCSGTCWRYMRILTALSWLGYLMSEKRLLAQRTLVAVRARENAARVGDPTVRATCA